MLSVQKTLDKSVQTKLVIHVEHDLAKKDATIVYNF